MSSFTPSDIKLFVSHLAMPALASYQVSGKLLTKNAAFEQSFGFKANSVDQFFKNTLHAQSKNPYARFIDEIASLANGNEKSEQLLQLQNANYEWGWYIVYASLYQANSDAEQNIIVFTFAMQSSHAELQHQLTESEQRFKTLADASFGGIAIHDKGVFLEANQGLSKMTGFNYDELIGMNGLLLIAPTHRDYVMERIVSGYEEPYEAVGIRKDGSIYPLEIQGKQVLYKGKLVRVTEFRDITQRKEFEKAIVESEVKYKQIIDFAVDGFIIGNSNGIVIEVNNRFLEIAGRTRDKVLGMHISSFFPKEVLEQTPFRFDLLEKGETVISQREITRPNGEIVFIEMHSKQMPDGTYQAIVRDVTERVNIENSVRQSEKLYRSIIENIEDVYFRYDLNQRLVLVSPSGASLFGFSSVNQMLGLPLDAFWVNSDEKQQFVEMLRTEGKARDYRTTLKTKKGKIITAYLSASYISNSKGERIGVEGIIHDITQRAKAEKALEHEQFLMRNLMDNVIDQVYFKDKESKFIRVSKNVAQRFGLKNSDDISGKSDFDFFSSEYAQKTYSNEQSIIATGKPLVNLEEKEVWKDGKVTWVSTTKMPFYDPDGNVVGIFGISRDITERKLYEIALKEREERAIRQRMAIAELAVDNRVAEANLSEAFSIVVKKSAEALAVARVGIWLLSDDKQSLVCYAMYDGQTKKFSKCQPLMVSDYPSYFKSIFKENRIFVNDVLTDERVKELKDGYLKPKGISSLLDAGVTIEGHLAGVVCFEHVGQKRNWEVDEESFAVTIASFVGQTILSSRRKESEKALAKSEERFRYVLEATNDGVWDWDLKTNRTFYSDNYYTMLGYKPSEFGSTYQSWIDLMHPNDREFTQILINKYLKEERPDFNAEFRLKAKDGSWRWIHARGKVVEYDNARKPHRVVGTHIDITERKQMEDELRDSANFLQTVLDTIPVRLFWKDTKLRYLGCNTQFAKDMGYNKPSNIIGKTDDELAQTEQNNQFRSDDLAIIKTGIPIITPEELLVAPDGSVRWVRSSKVPLRNSKGKTIGVLGVYDDITETVKARDGIELERVYFEQLFESSPEGIVLLDTNDCIVRCNKEFLRMFQFNEDEIIGKPINSLIVPDDLKDEGLKYTNTVADGDSLQAETIRKRKDGKLMNVSILGRPIYFQGGKIAVYGIYRDITDRKRVEEELVQKTNEIEAQNEEYRIINEELYLAKQKAEESDKLKSAFLANMSHEVRTPMNGILGFSQLLTNPDIPEVDVRQYVDVIQSCGNQLLCIINDLIDISKIESNQISIVTSKTNVNQIVHEQFLIFKEKTDQQGITLSYTTDLPDDKCTIVTDNARLKQILTNLIGNAVKFTREGYVKFGYKHRGNELEFFVQDTGIGIPSEMQSAVFERFMQVETAVSQQAGGTGLGLAISKAYVNKLGGSIWVNSSPGEGSTFYFTIPYKPSDEVARMERLAVDEYAKQIPSGVNVLVAEDDDVNYFFVHEMLADYSINIQRAADGNEAVELVRSNPNFDIVLMDIKMPGKDGFEATREIKEFRKELPIIAQTAYAFSTDKEKALAAGCDDYISKPIDRLKLVSLMAKHLKR
jgi:hypothetical protein